MVENQLRRRGIRDERVLDAFLRVPRHEFVPADLVHRAYSDNPLPIGEGQTISQPYMVALMTLSLRLSGGEKVLEIGTGSGYQSAILAEMGCKVYSVESLPRLARKAETLLKKLGYNVRIKVGDGTLGWEEYSPYERIIVTAGGPSVPNSLFAQLKEKGIMIIPVGDLHHQELTLVTKVNGRMKRENLGGCQFVRLKGREGWD